MLSHFASLALPSSVALLIGAWVIAGLRVRQGKPVGRDAILLAAIAPPLLVTGVLLASAPRFGDLRVALEGVRFRLEDLGQGFKVRVGGSADEDHIFVRDLPASFLTLELIESGEVKVELGQEEEKEEDSGLEDPRDELARKPFAVVRVDRERPFHNNVAIEEGDKVVVGSASLTFDLGRPAFGPQKDRFERIPPRTTEVGDLKVRVFRELRPEQAIHPLRYYGSTDRARELHGPSSEPLGSFIARDGRNPGSDLSSWSLPEILRQKLYLVLTEESVWVERKGKEQVRFQREVTRIPKEGSRLLALFRVDYENPWPPAVGKDDKEEPPPSRAQERRSFHARLEKGVLDLVFETPSYVQLGETALEDLRRRAEGIGVTPILRLMGRRFLPTAGEGQMLLEFAALGEPLAPELFSRIELPEDGRIRVTTHTGAWSHRLGDAFEIGGSAAAIIRISRIGLPWGTVLLAWAVSIVATVASRSWRERLLPLVLLSGVELLLALRVVIAYQGAAIDPAGASAAWQSLGALIAVPFVLLATLALYEGRWLSWDLALHALAVLAALATVLVRSHAEGKDWLLALVAVFGAPVILALPAIRVPKLLGGRILLFGLLPWLDRRRLDAPVDAARPFRPVWAAALLLIGIRLGTLIALGWKERIDLAPLAVLAVSIYFTPMALWIFARLWARRAESWTFFFLFDLLLVLYPLTSWLARDLGALLIFPIPVLMLFVLPWVEKRGWRSLALALPFFGMVFLFVVLPWVPALGLSPRLAGWTAAQVEQAKSDKGAAEKLLEGRTKISQNQLRQWNLMAPTELRQVGTQEAEGLVIVMANLRDYAGRGMLGEGYLEVPLSEALRATHLDDNLSAVHVLAAFGWLGGLALLALLCAWAVAPALALQGSSAGTASWIEPRTAFGLMTVWTLAVAGLYMFSANAGLLLFTGKNVYFLAAASRSDLVEGTLLVLLALWALAYRPGGKAIV